MRPGSIGELVRSEAIAFRVHFEGVPPPAAARYWRVRVLWESDGLIWRAGANPPASPGLTPLGEPVSYRVTLEPTGKTWLPALDLPFSAPAGAGLQGGAVLVRRRAVNERLVYDVRSHLAYRTGPLSARERNRGLAVPPTSDRVRALAQSWRNAAKSDEQVVQAALAYFRNQPFYYTLSPPTLGADPVDEFLFETRQGFCEHYAAAFTTLMRAAGVPARVVIGYQGGLHNPAGDYYMVRQADAHAWSEVWLESQGWVRVDPTAAVAPERVEQGIDSVGLADVEGRTAEAASETARWLARAWQRAHFTWDAFNLSWFYWVKDYDEDRQARLLERVGLHESAGVVLVAGVLGVALAYAWLAGRAPRPRDPLVRTYRRYCRKLARAGLPRSPNEGPLDYARRAGRRWPELRPTIEAITARYVALRYGPADARDEHAALERAVRHFAVRRRR
jgi:transglutaminase-like putative cysteine protease